MYKQMLEIRERNSKKRFVKVFHQVSDECKKYLQILYFLLCFCGKYLKVMRHLV